ncbi:hypothetical protein [Endozoicomonas ascidiicola]|uniref:hypothetical protein n=1 Tax=Endozoicomonas ascidiicola TaxID=1698521 RepID=UPI00082C2A5A|nr:hypothetical protein [Endozoicomonas ascidiicola]
MYPNYSTPPTPATSPSSPRSPSPISQENCTEQTGDANNSQSVETKQASTLDKTHALLLQHESTISGALDLAKLLAEFFEKPLPEQLNELSSLGIDTETAPQNQISSLETTVKLLDVYFQESPLNRQAGGNNIERWQVKDQKEKLQQLDSQQQERLREALNNLNLASDIISPITEQTNVILPGAAIPRMLLRPKFALKQNNIDVVPKSITCLGASRPLNAEIDFITEPTKNQQLFDKIDSYVNAFSDKLGTEKTEAHAQMALMDMLREENPDSFLSKQTIHMGFTGGVTYKTQTLTKEGNYQLANNETTGRANTEATIVTALHTLNQLSADNEEQELLLVSNQPHITAQQLATERVAALEPYKDSAITVHACGDKTALDTTDQLFSGIDSVRKSIQLLNPEYHVTTNWVKGKEPEILMFRSPKAGEWECLAPTESGITV